MRLSLLPSSIDLLRRPSKIIFSGCTFRQTNRGYVMLRVFAPKWV
jgi:hypothetical protein